MDPKDVVIATPTFYRGGVDDPRFRFACVTIEAARGLGYPICVVDGSPDARVAAAFRERKALVFPDLHQGLGPSKRQSVYHATEIARASGAQFIAMIEPEKYDMVRHLDLWCAPLAKSADVSVATRSEASWRGYPAFQAGTEVVANDAFARATGLCLDIMFGPVAFRIRTALAHFLNPWSYLGDGVEDTYIQHFGAIVAHARCLEVAASPPLDFQYPAEQRKQEEGAFDAAMREKRLWQRDSLIRAYEALARRYDLPRRA